jgi:hypothetical protein
MASFLKLELQVMENFRGEKMNLLEGKKNWQRKDS